MGRAETVEWSPWGVVRLSPQLPGCERIRDQRKRQEMEYPSRGLRTRGLLLDLEQPMQKHRPWVEVGRLGARSVGVSKQRGWLGKCGCLRLWIDIVNTRCTAHSSVSGVSLRRAGTGPSCQGLPLGRATRNRDAKLRA